MLFLCVVATLGGKAQTNTTQVILMGRAALYYDDYVTALHYFNSAIEARPYMAEAYYYRAYAKFSLEDYGSAEDDLTQAILFNPFHSEYYQLRGLCRINNKRYQEAIDDYDHVLADTPEDQGSNYNRVLCRLETKDFERASKELDHFIGRWPKFTRAYLLKAQTCLELGDTTSGMMWVDSLLTISKRESAAWGFKGRFALTHQDYELSDSCFTQALKYDVGNADYYLGRAQARHAMSLYNLALADYDRVIEMIPQHFVAHYNRGLIRKFVGDDNRAIDDFNFVIEAEADNVLAIFNRAELYQTIGDYRSAVRDYSTLINAYPNFLYGYLQRAKCYRALGQTARALKDETKVQAAELDLMFNKNRTKKIKSVRKRSEKALEQYDQLVEEDEDTTRTYIHEYAGKVQNRKVERVFLPQFAANGHNLSVEGGRHPIFCNDEQLLQLLERAAQLSESKPHDAMAIIKDYMAQGHADAVLYYNKGCVEAQSGSLENALEDFSHAIEQDPLMAEAYYNKAVVYLLINDTEAAAPLLSKAGEMGLFKAYNLLKQAKKQQ